MFCFKMLLLMIALCASVVAGEEESERAPFETLFTDVGADVEIRKYPARKWVSFDYVGPSMREHSRYLRRYLNGTNDQGVVLANVTLPRLTSSSPGKQHTVSFYIPQAFQANTPEPIEDGVYVEVIALTVYVKSYIAPSTDKEAEQETVAKLQCQLQAVSVPDLYYTANYGPIGSPEAFNEIWLVDRE